jgi:hypothetical protein
LGSWRLHGDAVYLRGLTAQEGRIILAIRVSGRRGRRCRFDIIRVFLLVARLLSTPLALRPFPASRQRCIRPGAQQKEPHAGERSDQRYRLEQIQPQQTANPGKSSKQQIPNVKHDFLLALALI